MTSLDYEIHGRHVCCFFAVRGQVIVILVCLVTVLNFKASVLDNARLCVNLHVRLSQTSKVCLYSGMA